MTVSFFFLMIRRPPRSTLDRSSAASDVYKRQDDDIPGLVTIPSLMGSTVVLTDETAVLQRWTEGASGSAKQSLGAPVGALARGAMSLDLRTDGPHALVAGTTGSGKSEFLQSYVAALALSHSPKLSLIHISEPTRPY